MSGSGRPVTGGTPDPDDPAVVALALDGESGCTATLIDGHTLLTAAHCFYGIDYRDLRAYFGDSVADGTEIELSAVRVHPDFEPLTFSYDLALATLRDDAPAAPLPIDGRTLDATYVGQTFRVVGFGVTAAGAGDEGVKRFGTAQVAVVDPTELTADPAPEQACVGDSGGPALFDDGGTTVITGVVSRGDSACTSYSIYVRLDVERAFIDAYLADTAPGTVHTGDACLYPDHCAEGPCLQTADDPALWFCSEACDRDDDCPPAMNCVADQCRYPTPSPGAIGSDCEVPADCSSAVCHDGVCSIECLGQDVVCPDGFVCEHQGGLDYYCLAAPPGGCCSTGADGASSLAMTLIVVALARRTVRSASRGDSRGRSPRNPGTRSSL